MKRTNGFTLVELLVVISIIALLLGILMPALNSARENGRSTLCKSNIKGITLAASLWSEDHKGYVPPAMWYVPAKPFANNTSSEASLAAEAIAKGASLEPYTASNEGKSKNLYSCPTATVKFGEKLFYITTSYYTSDGAKRKGTTSYGINSFATVYTGTTDYLGSVGSLGGAEATYASWGPSNAYVLEHGKSKVLEIPSPSNKVYFMDFSYPTVYTTPVMTMYDPLKVCFQPSSRNSYITIDKLSSVPPGAYIVQSRWHGKTSKVTGYGYGNMGWFDGSVSGEPKGYDDKTVLKGSGFGSKRYNWQKYFCNFK
jgi:prepilin-type N-terminal cleavage/methylation domain-containing protein/prepilin-type processing-associated H-X9-DG protein